MSHYAVAVFQSPGGKDYEELLAPFDENIESPHYISKSDIISKVRNDIEKFKSTRYAEYLKNPKEYEAECQNDAHIDYIKKEFPIKLHWTDEDCYLDGIKYYEKDDIQPDGSVFSNYNAQSKWDWYSVGGRFTNSIPLKDGSYTDDANINDIEINGHDEKMYKQAIRFWQLYVDGEEPMNDEDREIIRFSFYNKDYYTSLYDSAEEYASWVSGFTFYAALLPNGEWLEPRKMGWWGISSASADDEKAWRKKIKDILRDAKDGNWNVTIVDCHI